MLHCKAESLSCKLKNMILLSNIFSQRRILSLRTGNAIGFAYSPIINAHTFKVEGWYATLSGSKESMILPVLELRDIIAKGFVVNDHDAITPTEDMIRLKSVIDEDYTPIGKTVETDDGRKLGKVADYAVDSKSLFIKKLYVKQGLLQSLTSLTTHQVIIDRSQIIDVTPSKIIVREATVKASQPRSAPARA